MTATTENAWSRQRMFYHVFLSDRKTSQTGSPTAEMKYALPPFSLLIISRIWIRFSEIWSALEKDLDQRRPFYHAIVFFIFRRWIIFRGFPVTDFSPWCTRIDFRAIICSMVFGAIWIFSERSLLWTFYTEQSKG